MGRRACLPSLPGLTPQVGYTRLAAHKNAQLGQARVAMQSILFARSFAKMIDHPKSGLPDFGHFKCASRINPTCVVKPAGDATARRAQSAKRIAPCMLNRVI